ncbi:MULTISPECIES: hypothetical protein, partial [unclassified Microcoleus]|uniref:hypothetical protein n=1 Tax=unclassified Microcoleus TaxID=2642155 RepID=UPI002FD3872A
MFPGSAWEYIPGGSASITHYQFSITFTNSVVSSQLSAVNCQLSTVNCQQSTVNCQLSTVIVAITLFPGSAWEYIPGGSA